MERRHYFSLVDPLIPVTSITRVFSEVGGENKVVGYKINGSVNIELSGTEEYDLLTEISNEQPIDWAGVVFDSIDDKEFWTKDGLYLHVEDNEAYIKDFLEDIPEDYQGYYLNKITEGDHSIIEKINKIAENMLDLSYLSPKEFLILNDGEGIIDEIVAIEGETYFINSSNDYIPYTSNRYSTDWAIHKDVYETLSDKNPTDVNFGRNKHLYLRSNSLLYLFTFDGMDEENDPIIDNSPLTYISYIEYEGENYQIYLNSYFIYNKSGVMDELSNEWQVIKIEDLFTQEELLGKVLRVV